MQLLVNIYHAVQRKLDAWTPLAQLIRRIRGGLRAQHLNDTSSVPLPLTYKPGCRSRFTFAHSRQNPSFSMQQNYYPIFSEQHILVKIITISFFWQKVYSKDRSPRGDSETERHRKVKMNRQEQFKGHLVFRFA